MPRPQRASAAAAQERIHSRDEPHFDGQTESESEESGEDEVTEEEAGPSEPAPLSEYELQRQRNIENNNQKLEALGLAGGAIAASAGATARAPASAARPRASPASSSADSSAATAVQTPRTRKRGRVKEEEEEEEEPSSPVLLNDQQRLVAAALFRGLQGRDMSNVVAEPALTERLTVAALSRVTNELGLENVDADMVGDMIAFHDTSGNNSLSFADFLRIVRTAGPGVLDLDGGGNTHCR